MVSINVIGIRCGRPFSDIVEHFRELGGDVILLNSEFVCGKDHILSAFMHAERAFAYGTNRSKTLLTETILYAAGERQISKALAKMRPSGESIVAAVLDVDDPRLGDIDATEDDDLLKCTKEKLKNLGLNVLGKNYGGAVLEMVAAVDIQKQ